MTFRVFFRFVQSHVYYLTGSRSVKVIYKFMNLAVAFGNFSFQALVSVELWDESPVDRGS